MCFYFFYFSAVLLSSLIFPPISPIKKTDCPLLQMGMKRKRKSLTLESKMLVIRKMEAGKKRANVRSSLGLALGTVTFFLMSSELWPGPSLAK
jgi:hypothetical protein